MLAEAKSEVRKQECRADFLDSSVRDLQRQLDSNRMEVYGTNQGYDESREEQARLHEESAQRERLLRETQIRSIPEVGELKRAQEMRIDEFSRNELRESHATIRELTSQIQELQARMIYIHKYIYIYIFFDSREFQDIESICLMTMVVKLCSLMNCALRNPGGPCLRCPPKTMHRVSISSSWSSPKGKPISKVRKILRC